MVAHGKTTRNMLTSAAVRTLEMTDETKKAAEDMVRQYRSNVT